ncbi:MAG: PAS domain-containing protein [Rhodospirillaceae bacterium]|nr:PAS domain-containing protein [Rhodospirillaceae bacterium]MCA8930970.1 PAS domain-containing protein [Rhodospirillaceae bacterium]
METQRKMPWTSADALCLFDFSTDDFQDAKLTTFFKYWQERCRGRTMPAREDLDPTEIPPAILPYVCLFEVVPGPRFRVKLAGTEAVAQSGVAATGHFVDSVPGGEGVQERMSQAVQRKQPYYCRTRLTWSLYDFKSYETVMCPLSGPVPDEVGYLVNVTVFSLS